jgi:hypothetical protein
MGLEEDEDENGGLPDGLLYVCLDDSKLIRMTCKR